ncbi:MAG: xylan 1,4-beta-xylosidase [Bacteroidales bacterium]|nr:xylan 1,4-beta-xylosidase [Bacteroidales bacterium]
MKKNIILCVTIVVALVGCNKKNTWQDTDLAAEKRAEALVKELTLDEKIRLMMDVSAPVERLGIKQYNWWNESLHGIARNGLSTVFPMPIGMSASFNPSLLHDVFVVASDEARAKNTKAKQEGEVDRYEGLTVWTPNINIFRDPRWGRGFETYGEDPYLTSVMGLEVVRGLQCLEANEKYEKLHACAKHFAVHSGPESSRHQFDAADISPRDLYETYLPAFETLVREGKVREVMCAYNRFEGDPCCGSDKLLMQILRGEWGYDGIVLSDCGAIDDFYKKGRHETYPDGASATAKAVLTGTDLECGSSYKHLKESVERGLITEESLNTSVTRLLKARFQLGEMDPDELVSWTQIPYSKVATAESDMLALRMARESMVLLQNRDNILPLKRGGQTIAVVGPNANDSIMLWGNYNGQPRHTITILEGIREKLGPTDKLVFAEACDCVEEGVKRSIFGDCKADGKNGFKATYWNNVNQEGDPVTQVQMEDPFHLCTMGDNPFAPSVNLKDFSARYECVLTPQKSGEVIFDFYQCGQYRLSVDGTEIKKASAQHGGGVSSKSMQVQAGKGYAVQIDWTYCGGEAQLDFDISMKEQVSTAEVLRQVKDADVVVFVGGISPRLEGEEMGVKLPGFRGGDRTDIELPAVQRHLLQALSDAGKPVVLVNCSGSAIGFVPETKSCKAILQAWYGGQRGGTAVADVLFGDYNPAGRLPITFYKNIEQLPEFEDYNMAGHTYRYLKEEPLFPFGYGLSYTTFGYGNVRMPQTIKAGQPLTLQVEVRNQGGMDGDEVVQVYLRKHDDPMGPFKSLRAFKRVHVKAGAAENVSIELTPKQLAWWDESSNTIDNIVGTFDVLVGGSSADGLTNVLTIE